MDSYVSSVLPDLIECGFAAVHPIQRECMDMAAVKQNSETDLHCLEGSACRVSCQTAVRKR